MIFTMDVSKRSMVIKQVYYLRIQIRYPIKYKQKIFYKDMYEHKELFDLSDIKDDRFKEFYDGENKKVIGKMKPEYVNNIITEFIGLRSKMYSLKFDNNAEEKKAKGVKKYVVKKDLKHENYNEILTSGQNIYSTMKMIRSSKHQLYTMEMNKVSLSAYDDKRYILHDGISSYAYG